MPLAFPWSDSPWLHAVFMDEPVRRLIMQESSMQIRNASFAI
jgi:hypothetical protein